MNEPQQVSSHNTLASTETDIRTTAAANTPHYAETESIVAEEGTQDNVSGPDGDREASLPSPLPLPLKVLYCFNGGVTLSLPWTALLYIVNNRVAMPVNLLPTYAAVSFLPFSLKPMYAYLNNILNWRRDHLLACLLLCNGVFIATTSFIQPHAIGPCFLLGFLRGTSSAWAEFLLEMVLLDHVRRERLEEGRRQRSLHNNLTDSSSTDNKAAMASRFQSQAATARGIGSLVSYAAASLYFGVPARKLNDTSVFTLLMATAVVPVVGAVIVLATQLGRGGGGRSDNMVQGSALVDGSASSMSRSRRVDRDHSYHSVGVTDEDDGPEAEMESVGTGTMETESSCGPSTTLHEASLPQATRTSSQTFALVIFLQVALILLTTREPIVEGTSAVAWNGMMLTVLVALVGCGCSGFVTSLRWDLTRRIGLYLLLRSAVPSSAYIVDSYMYTLLESHPLVLQLLSVNAMGFSTLAAWSYGRLWSRPQFTRGTPFYLLIVITTTFASLMSLSQVAYVTVLPKLDISRQFCVILLVQSFMTLAGEWKFLPDLVIATVAVVDDNSLCTDPSLTPEQHELPQEQQRHPVAEQELQYGTLVSCIDFGGQLGSLLVGPLVSSLHVNRENGWANLDTLVELTALLNLLSPVLLLLLPGISSAISRALLDMQCIFRTDP